MGITLGRPKSGCSKTSETGRGCLKTKMQRSAKSFHFFHCRGGTPLSLALFYKERINLFSCVRRGLICRAGYQSELCLLPTPTALEPELCAAHSSETISALSGKVLPAWPDSGTWKEGFSEKREEPSEVEVPACWKESSSLP